MAKPSISVILPCYNVGDYVLCCLESIIGQTFQDFEVICVDDLSTDNTADVISKFSHQNKKVTLIRCQKNGGAGEARNVGLRHANGTYISFIDPDDWLLPQKLETELYWISTTGLASVNSNYLIYKDNIETAAKGWNPPQIGHTMIGEESIASFPSSVCNKLYRKDALDRSGATFIPRASGHDLEFNFRFYLQHPHTYVIDECLYVYRQRLDSISNTIVTGRGKPKDLMEIFEGCRQALLEPGHYFGMRSLLGVMEVHTYRYLQNKSYRDELIVGIQNILTSIDFGAYETSSYPLMECIFNHKRGTALRSYKLPYRLISKVLPWRKARKKLRAWIDLNCQ